MMYFIPQKMLDSVIKKLTAVCSREDCSLTEGASTTTCMYFPTTYDKYGRITNKDYNTTTTGWSCNACGKRWTVKTGGQYVEPEIKEIGE